MADCTRDQTGETASDAAVPPIPAWLADLPTVGGLVVPWVTPRTADGRYLLGTVSERRFHDAFHGRLCGVCGRGLGDRMVLLLRLSDLPQRCSYEPALHPQCAAYTIAACPMVNGRLRRYRSTPHRLDATLVQSPDVEARRGAPAEPWFAVWLPGYRVVVDHGNLAASYDGMTPLRVRPITWRLPAFL